MNLPGPAVLSLTAVPRSELGSLELLSLAALALFCTGFFATLRVALMHSVPARLLDRARSPRERARLTPLVERTESLATSASVFEITCQILFLVLVLSCFGGESVSWSTIGWGLLVCVPLLVLAGEVVPSALRGERTEALLPSVLPAFDVLQRPLAAVSLGLEGTRRALMRLLRIPERPPAVRRIVEDLREVIEDSERQGDLQEAEREIIENVVEFYDVDVAEIMTPRTELTAVEVSAGVPAVVSAIAESGHGRIPVFEGNLDTVIGVAYAQEILELVSRGELEQADLRRLLQPVSFVPETKLVSELLAQFRRDRQKLVVVVDEYGGTAGLVTMGDVLSELVGDMREELGEATPDPIRRHEDGTVDVDAGTRISEVNEELALELSEEEDYETLAGFVLAQLGRFPKQGESFAWQGIDFEVTGASDRRVSAVRLRLPQPQKA